MIKRAIWAKKHLVVSLIFLFVILGLNGVLAVPVTSDLGISPNPTNINPTLTATITESNGSNIINSAQYRVDSGGWIPLSATDGAFDETVEDVNAVINIGALSQGNHTVYVQGSSNYTGWGTSVSTTFIKDTINPVVDAGTSKIINTPTLQDATVSDATTLTYSWTKVAGPGVVIFGSPNSEDTTISANAQGIYTIKLTATDAAGNSAFDETIFEWDTIAPSLTSVLIVGAATGNRFSPADSDGVYDSVSFWMNANELVDWGRTRVYNSSMDEVKYFNGVSDVTSNTETWTGGYNDTIPPFVPDGTYTIYTNMTDKAGNSVNVLVGSVIVDNTAPTGTIGRGTATISPNTGLTQIITINYNEAMDTAYTPRINFTNNIGEIRSQENGAWSLGNTRWTETFLVEDADEESIGVGVVSSLARDIAGNLENSTDPTFNIDTKAPVITDLDASSSDLEINNDDNVMISAKIIEGYGTISNVRLEGNWTGSWINHTSFTIVGDVYSYVVGNVQLENQEYIGWRFYATDNLGNIRVSDIYKFLVENRAPQFTPAINNMSWIEDGGLKTIDLSAYFDDLDLDDLNYTAVITQTPGPTSNPLGGGITVVIDNSTKIATISSTEDWNGDGTIVFYAWDFVGEYNTSNTIHIGVLADDNERPTITSNVSPVNFSEDTNFAIQLTCDPNDPGQTCLNYRYNPNYINYSSNLIVNVNPSTGYVTFNTELDWNGLTYVEFLVDDDGTILQTGSLVVRVNVTPVNDNPLLDAPDIELIENDPAPAPINLLSYTTDVDNPLIDMNYNFVSQSNSSLINCVFNGISTIICSAPTYNNYGISDLVVEVTDGSGGFDTQKITIEVKQDHAPVITSYSPLGSPSVRTGNSQAFSIVAQDSDSPVLDYQWYVEGTPTGTNSPSYSYPPASGGSYEIKVEVTDGISTVDKIWNLTASDYPVASEFDGDDTTDLSAVSDLTNVENLTLENSYGKIEFLSSVDLTNAWDLNSNVEISGNGVVAVNTQEYSALNKPARITLYGLSYSSIPKIYYTSGFTVSSSAFTSECSSEQCTMINYTDFSTTNGQAVFTVSEFSSYYVKGSGLIYDIDELDIDSCENGIQGNLIIEIKKPDEDETFGAGEEIEIEVKVENEGDEDEKFLVKGILFNYDEEEELESEESDSIKIEAGDSETFEFSITVPEGFDEEDEHFLFVKAYQKGEEEISCNYKIVKLSLEREEHKVIIDDVTSSPEITYANGKVNFDIKLKNIGSSDEDSYVKITNSELGISEKSEIFEIEEYGEEDEYSLSEIITIPYGTVNGKYPLKVEVFFKGGSNYTIHTLTVDNSTMPIIKNSPIYLTSSSGSSSGSAVVLTTPSTGNVIYSTTTKTRDDGSSLSVTLTSEDRQAPVTEKSKATPSTKYPYLLAGLIGGIVIFILLITFLWLRKR